MCIRDRDQVAQAEQQDKDQQPAQLVLDDALPQEFQAEVIPQAGEFEDREQHAQEQDDAEQLLVAAHRLFRRAKPFHAGHVALQRSGPVSYTHLDVYKRQPRSRR